MNSHAQTALSAVAMLLVGAMGFALIFHAVPHENAQLVTFVLGALSGALVVGGTMNRADKVNNTVATDVTSSQS